MILPATNNAEKEDIIHVSFSFEGVGVNIHIFCPNDLEATLKKQDVVCLYTVQRKKGAYPNQDEDYQPNVWRLLWFFDSKHYADDNAGSDDERVKYFEINERNLLVVQLFLH